MESLANTDVGTGAAARSGSGPSSLLDAELVEARVMRSFLDLCCLSRLSNGWPAEEAGISLECDVVSKPDSYSIVRG